MLLQLETSRERHKSAPYLRKKSQCRKKTEKGGDSLVFPGMLCYAEKEGKLFGSVR